jgi:alkanesulfonate monooxygenase SsuD/methylene tetrahydromethanopterin reductase-like flavin-dependent oxidoreductase (luciferase family)
MLVESGFPEVAETKAWSDRMIDAVLLSGDESRVRERLLEMFSFGATEIIVSPVLAGGDRAASMERTLHLLADVSASL